MLGKKKGRKIKGKKKWKKDVWGSRYNSGSENDYVELKIIVNVFVYLSENIGVWVY